MLALKVLFRQGNATLGNIIVRATGEGFRNEPFLFFMKKKYYSVNKETLKKLESCSHEIGSAGPGLEDYSEWAMTRALKLMPDKFTEKQFENEITESSLIEGIIALSNDGLIDFYWDPDIQSVVFKVNETKESTNKPRSLKASKHSETKEKKHKETREKKHKENDDKPKKRTPKKPKGK